MNALPMLVMNYYDSYSYQVPVAVFKSAFQASDIALELNVHRRLTIEADIMNCLHDAMNKPVPEYQDELAEMEFHAFMNQTDDERSLRDRLERDIGMNNYSIEAIAYDINEYSDLVQPDNMAKYLDRHMSEEYYSVTTIDFYNGEQT